MMLEKHHKKRSWKDWVNEKRVGAGYFLGLQGRPEFTPNEYIEFRAVRREDSSKLLQEWDSWIRNLRTCPYEHVRIAAGLAASMCHRHLDAYYRDRVMTESEMSSLENSSKKLADSEQELISLARKRRAERNQQEDSGDTYYTRSAHEGGNIVEKEESDNVGELKQQDDPNNEKLKKKSRIDFEAHTRRADAFTPTPRNDNDRHPALFTGEGVLETNSFSSSTVINTSLPTPSTPTILKRGRTRRNAGPSKIAGRESSKTRIKEPWLPLIERALLLYDGWKVDLPEVDVGHEQESTRRSSLYQLALQHLHTAKILQAQTKFDKHHCLDYKDAFVALSGIWNTFSSSANAWFSQTSIEEAKALCYIPSLDVRDTVLAEIVDSLLQKKSLEEILDETYHLQVAHPTYRRILDVIHIITRNIIRPLYGSRSPSEADCVALWSSIFQEGLPLNSRFSMNLGEQGCSASGLSKSKLADVFETGSTPRKCDGLLSVNSVEVGNFEFKRASASKLEVACQLRKNIKINKSILLELGKYELECPPLLSIHGMSAVVFRVREWHDIWVAGRASGTIVLPSSFDELRFFLGNPIHQLAKMLDHYHEYSEHANRMYQQYQYQKKGEDAEDAVSSASKNVTEILEWEQVVFHTPTKVAKRPSLLDRLERAKEEADQGSSEDEVENLLVSENSEMYGTLWQKY